MAASDENGPASQTLKALLGIRDLICFGGVAPGERLSEASLSHRLGISRTPVRSALARLELENLVIQIPSGGYSVRAFTEEDVIDAIETRGVMEGMAVRLAAERGAAPNRLAALKTVVAEIDGLLTDGPEAVDFEAYVAANAEFHRQLAELSGSDVVAESVRRSALLPFAGPSAFVNVQTELPEFFASLVIAQSQHRCLVQAVENREGARAEALAREHARLALHNLERVMGDHRLVSKVPGLSLVSG